MKKGFEWSRLGNIQSGRGNLGEEMPVAVYRLLQYTLLDELEERYGAETAQAIMRDSGYRAGRAFGKNIITQRDSFSSFVADLQQKLREMKIGILRIEKSDMENFKFTLTVSEDLDCSGLPISGETVCTYDEGFISGILEDFTGERFEVSEVDCWATGDRTCRFTANRI